MTQYSAFSTEVRCQLIKRGWNFADLGVFVHEKTGLFCDGAYISKILSGKRRPKKIIAAIREILGIPEEMEDSA